MLEKVEKPKTLKDTALEQLRLAIMIGQLAPGQRLVERTICEQLGVSRTVVRECIRHLESEHLVTFSAGGSSVAVLESDEIRQIYHRYFQPQMLIVGRFQFFYVIGDFFNKKNHLMGVYVFRLPYHRFDLNVV